MHITVGSSGIWGISPKHEVSQVFIRKREYFNVFADSIVNTVVNVFTVGSTTLASSEFWMEDFSGRDLKVITKFFKFFSKHLRVSLDNQ